MEGRNAMAATLEQAFAEAAKLPQSDQEALAAWILEELASERRWSASFERSPDLLAALAAEALADYEKGETQLLDPERLLSNPLPATRYLEVVVPVVAIALVAQRLHVTGGMGVADAQTGATGTRWTPALTRRPARERGRAAGRRRARRRRNVVESRQQRLWRGTCLDCWKKRLRRLQSSPLSIKKSWQPGSLRNWRASAVGRRPLSALPTCWRLSPPRRSLTTRKGTLGS